MAVTADDKYIVSCSRDNLIKVFDWKNKQEIHRFEQIHEGK